MIDDVRIESDENGFLLQIEGDLSDEFYALETWMRADAPSARGVSFRLTQDVALALRRAVREQIDPWWAEGEAVRHEFEQHMASGQPFEPAEGYALDDPKRPGYRERMADAADLARKAERENRG